MTKKSRSPTRFSGMASLLGGSAWAIREGDHRQLVNTFNQYLRAGPAGDGQLDQLRAMRETRAADLSQAQEGAQGVGVISLYGTIVPRGDIMIEYCGAASPHNFADAVTQAMNDSTVSSIVLDIDSGGGAVSGIDVAYEAVRRASLVKPVTAVVNTMCCSAALWIASAAREIVITPAGEIGSIGVIGTHVDQSAAYDEAGIKVTYVRSTPGKALGQSTEAMDGPVLESWQSEVDRIHTLFISAVAQGRGRTEADVRANWATGAVWFGQEAVVAGLADRVGTLNDVLGAHLLDAQQQQARQARKGRAASGLLRRLDARVDHLRGLQGAPLAQLVLEAVPEATVLTAELDRACADSTPEELTDFQLLRAETVSLQEQFDATVLAAHTPVTPPPIPEEEPLMKLKLKASDGTEHEVENTQEAIEAFLVQQQTAHVEASKVAVHEASEATGQRVRQNWEGRLTDIGALFALTPEQSTASDLAPWEAAARSAAAVSDYRAAMLAELEQLAVTVDGNTGAAAQIVKLASAASLTDLSATVVAYRDRRDALVPGRRSVDKEITEGKEEAKTPARKPNYDRN